VPFYIKNGQKRLRNASISRLEAQKALFSAEIAENASKMAEIRSEMREMTENFDKQRADFRNSLLKINGTCLFFFFFFF
jgi:hypothetical protein